MCKSAILNARGDLAGIIVYTIGENGWEVLHEFGHGDSMKTHSFWADTRKRECPREHERLRASKYRYYKTCRYCGETFPMPEPECQHVEGCSCDR